MKQTDGYKKLALELQHTVEELTKEVTWLTNFLKDTKQFNDDLLKEASAAEARIKALNDANDSKAIVIREYRILIANLVK